MVISLLVVIVDFGLDGCCCWGYGWLLRLVLVCVVWCVLFCVGVVKRVFSLLLLFVGLFIAMPLTCRVVCRIWFVFVVLCAWWVMLVGFGGVLLLDALRWVLILRCYNTTL